MPAQRHKNHTHLSKATSKRVASPVAELIHEAFLRISPEIGHRAKESFSDYRLYTTIPTGKEGFLFRAVSEVVSPEGRKYKTTFSITDKRTAQAFCTCEYFQKKKKPCKHVAMLLLDLMSPGYTA